MVERDGEPRQGQGEHDAVDVRPAHERRVAEDDHQRVHQDPLVPAEPTGVETETEAGLEAPAGGDGGDQEGGTDDPAAVSIAGHSTGVRVNGEGWLRRRL